MTIRCVDKAKRVTRRRQDDKTTGQEVYERAPADDSSRQRDCEELVLKAEGTVRVPQRPVGGSVAAPAMRVIETVVEITIDLIKVLEDRGSGNALALALWYKAEPKGGNTGLDCAWSYRHSS